MAEISLEFEAGPRAPKTQELSWPSNESRISCVVRRPQSREIVPFRAAAAPRQLHALVRQPQDREHSPLTSRNQSRSGNHKQSV